MYFFLHRLGRISHFMKKNIYLLGLNHKYIKLNTKPYPSCNFSVDIRLKFVSASVNKKHLSTKFKL